MDTESKPRPERSQGGGQLDRQPRGTLACRVIIIGAGVAAFGAVVLLDICESAEDARLQAMAEGYAHGRHDGARSGPGSPDDAPEPPGHPGAS